jgi:hypothetical protein
MRFVAAGSAVAVIGYTDVVFGHAIEVAAYRPLEPAYRTRLGLTIRDVARQGRRGGRKSAFVGLLQEHLKALYRSKPVSDKPKHTEKIAGFGAVAKRFSSNPGRRMG